MEKKTSKNILLIIMGVLIVAELVISVYVCFTAYSALYHFIDLVALIGVALYGFWFYKKPHGNMLKYAMLLSALSIVVSTNLLLFYGWEDSFIEGFLPILAACLIFYVAGRLNRIEQNKYLLTIIAIILLVCCIIEYVSIPAESVAVVIRYHTAPRELISFLTLMIAYFVRFKEHKEAGLADTPKAK